MSDGIFSASRWPNYHEDAQACLDMFLAEIALVILVRMVVECRPGFACSYKSGIELQTSPISGQVIELQSILPMHHECKTYLQDSRVTQDSSGKACSP
jgi:hypothetical protein